MDRRRLSFLIAGAAWLAMAAAALWVLVLRPNSLELDLGEGRAADLVVAILRASPLIVGPLVLAWLVGVRRSRGAARFSGLVGIVVAWGGGLLYLWDQVRAVDPRYAEAILLFWAPLAGGAFGFIAGFLPASRAKPLPPIVTPGDSADTGARGG